MIQYDAMSPTEMYERRENWMKNRRADGDFRPEWRLRECGDAYVLGLIEGMKAAHEH